MRYRQSLRFGLRSPGAFILLVACAISLAGAVAVWATPKSFFLNYVLTKISPDGILTDIGKVVFEKTLKLARFALLLGSILAGVCVFAIEYAESAMARRRDAWEPLPEDSRPPDVKVWLAIVGLCGAAWLLGAWHLDDNFGGDEAGVMTRRVLVGFGTIFGLDLDFLHHDIADHVLSHAMARIGYLASNEVRESSVRLPGVALAALTVVFGYRLGRLMGLKTVDSLAASALIAFSSQNHFFSAIIRGYGPSSALLAWALFEYALLITGSRRANSLRQFLALYLLGLCLFSNMLLIAAFVAHLLLLPLHRTLLPRHETSPNYSEHTLIVVLAFFASQLTLVLLYPAYLKASIVHANQGGGYSILEFAAGTVMYLFVVDRGVLGTIPAAVVGIMVVVSAMAAFLGGLRGQEGRTSGLLSMTGFLVLSILTIASIVKPPLRLLSVLLVPCTLNIVWTVRESISVIFGRTGKAALVGRAVPLVASCLICAHGAWFTLTRPNGEPVNQTIERARAIADGRPVWSTGMYNGAGSWDRCYPGAVTFLHSPPASESVFVMLMDGKPSGDALDEETEAVRFVKSRGLKVDEVKPGYSVWVCPKP